MSTPNSNAGHGAGRCKTNTKPGEREFEIDVELVPPAESKPAEARAATDEDDEVQLAELVKPASDVELNDTARFAESAEPTRVNLPEPLSHEPPIRGGIPDWLSDVQPAIKASTLPLNAIPDWIADVAEIEVSLSCSGGRPIASIGWLADIGRLENLHAATPPQTNVDPIPPVQTPAANPATAGPPVPVNPTNAAQSPAISTASITKAFYDARNALAQWVDDDCRRNLILTADFEDLKKHPEIKAIIAQFRSYGPLMRDKLLNHVEFLAKNRRKYYAACEK